MFNAVHFPCNCTRYIDVRIANLLHNFIFVVFASTCFGFESRPSSGSYESFERTQRVWQLIYTYVVNYILVHHCQFLFKLQC